MKYLKWIGLIFRILPHLEKLWAQIIVSIEIIKEELDGTETAGVVKKKNVTEKLVKKLPMQPSKLGGIIDNSVSLLKDLNVL